MLSHGREVEVKILSAKDIKNVNWRNGPNRPYAVVWVDPKYKSSTRVDEDDDTCPNWNETFVIPLPLDNNDDDDKVYIDIVHAGREENTKPLISSAYISLRDVIHDVGFGVPVVKSLKLKRPSGRPHGKLDVSVIVRESWYHPVPGLSYGYTYMPPQPVYASPTPVKDDLYTPQSYEQSGNGYAPEKGCKFGGTETRLAVESVAGVALAEGLKAVEENIAEKATEKVEEVGERRSWRWR